MEKVSIWFFHCALLFLVGFSLINPSWADNNTAKAEINTGIEIDKEPLRCPPFGIGDSWTMQRTNIMANGMSSKTDFTITITDHNGKIVKSESVEPGGTTIQSEMRLKKGILYPVKDIIGNHEIKYVSNTPLCPPAKIGQSIIGYGTMNGMKVGEQSTTVTAINPNYFKVSVPAGTFNTRVVVNEVKTSGPQASPPYTITHYYADGIGAVKEVFKFADGSTQIHELLEYKF